MMKTQTKNRRKSLQFAIALLCLLNLTSMAHAESLFRAGISYQTSQPYTPRSLFAMPRPTGIGDMITITINEVSQVNMQNNNTITKEHTINENSTSFFNQFIQDVFKTRRTPFPTIDGLDNSHEIGLSARGQKQIQYRDSITCQVVQVLPNGNLVVQGRKTLLASQEQQDLLVSGIVNPYYLDSKNSITSQRVANLQMHVTGKGAITRQQGDGIFGKYFQFLN